MSPDSAPRPGGQPRPSRWDQGDDPTVRLLRPFRRLAVPFEVILLLFGTAMAVASLLRAERVGSLLVGGLLWLGVATVAPAARLIRRVRGKEPLSVPPGLQGAELEEAKRQIRGVMWKQLRATSLFMVALTATYALIAVLDPLRREPLMICAAVVAGLAIAAALGSFAVYRTYVRASKSG